MSGDPPFDLPILSPEELYRRAQEVDPWPSHVVGDWQGSRVDYGRVRVALEPALFEGLVAAACRASRVLSEHINRWQEALLYALSVPGWTIGLDRPTERELAVARHLRTQMLRTERRAARRARRAARRC